MAYEEPIKKVIEERLSPGAVAFDIGACKGEVTRYMIDKGAQVYAFDILQENIDHLKKTFPTVHTELIAISDHVGIVELKGVSGQVNDHMHCILDRPQCRMTNLSTKVPCTDLGTWCNEHQIYPDFIKIDVESAEALILPHLGDSLKRRPTEAEYFILLG